jgi:hypothetical protein
MKTKGCDHLSVTTIDYEKPTKNHYINLLHEDIKNYNIHDQLFKNLIHNFFTEFLEAFFPEVHHFVDISTFKPISEEVFTDLVKGRSKRADIVIETKLKGEETFIIIHVEPQSSYESNFHERMYHYFSLLYNKYRKPILPIAIFSYDDNHTERDQFTIQFPFFHVLTFNILMLELKKKNWRAYIESDNPVAAALLSKMGYEQKEKVQVKKEFLKMLLRMELNPAQSRFINEFFDTYLHLNSDEEEELMKEIKELDIDEEIFNKPNFWEKRGMTKVALNLLRKGLSDEFVEEVTSLEKSEIEKLKKSL